MPELPALDADPACQQADQVYGGKAGNRGVYLRDPDGHPMEILTTVVSISRAYSAGPATVTC